MDEINDDSDRELQVAFKKGLLKNLVRQTEKVVPKSTYNKQGLIDSLESFKKSLPWSETLDVCVDPLPIPNCVSVESSEMAENHIKRENLFYRQAQAAVLFGLEKLKKLKIPTQRPNDYYAEMAKSDAHMKKVKEKLLSVQAIKEKAEKAKKDREARKFNKLAAKENKIAKKKEKLKNKDQLKKMKKKLSFGKNEVEDKEDKKVFKGGKLKPNMDKPNRSSNKRNLKNKKFGFGGQKKRSKMNNKDSFNDI